MPLKRDLLKERLLDPKAYNTVYISLADENKAKKEQTDIIIELICDDRHKADRVQVLAFIKKEPKAAELLMTAIQEAGPVERKKLLTACWEADLDCTPYLDMFADIVMKDDFPIAMEALTSIENMHGVISTAQAEQILNRIMEIYPQQADTPKGHLLADLIELLRKWQ
jgi:hypothetical protein